MKLVWKLLRQHISVPQFAGFFFANLVGMLIVLLGVQFYIDTQSVYNGEDSFMKEDYLIVNKQIGAVTTITGKSNAFTKSEIKDLKNQDFVEKIGAFIPSAFDVSARFDIQDFSRFSTEMFFESVPDEFVDVKTESWDYQEGSKDIPIIIPRNYLDLYNFGFAQSRNMPKLSEGILGAMKLMLSIRGKDQVDEFEGRIVGFSSRLNTILVPEKFMLWANEKYAEKKASEPTRLILQVNNPTDERITSYLQENNYVTDEDKLDASKTTFILRIIVGIVMAIGLIISILSFYILMLSIYLLVEKNNTKLENLLLLGYSPSKVSRPYQWLTVGLNIFVLVLALALLYVVRSIYLHQFRSFFPDFEAPSMWPAFIIGIALLLLVSIFNLIAIKRKVMSIWNKKE
ncbi:MAG: ABC transporter permease [Bacteroidaceae bacterium]|nr:ABC transporter permease [Bacteroidaceae bacterium]